MPVASGNLGETLTQQFSRSFNSFSGCDLQVTFGPLGKRIGELQGLSFTITREKAPIYVMGKKDPAGFARGKRGIAGSLVFATFDRAALLSALQDGEVSNFITNTEEINLTDYRTAGQLQSSTKFRSGGSLGAAGSTSAISIEDPRNVSFESHPAWYVDQIPPFNIVVNAVNEYGAASVMRIHNVEIMNSGSGMSIDDIMIDETMTYTATNIVLWKPYKFIDPISAGVKSNFR